MSNTMERKNINRISSESTCKKTKTPPEAKERTAMTSKSKKLQLESSPKQIDILSVKADNGQVMIEFRAPSSTVPSTSGTDCDPKQAKQNENKVEDEIEFSEPSISALSIPTTNTERHNYQTVPACSIKVEDDVDIKIKDEMEFCALSDIDQSTSENEDEEPNNQTNLNGFTEFKVEDEMEFGATSISVQSISTIDREPQSNQTIQDEFTETEDEMEFCDDVEIDALNTPESIPAEKSDESKVNKKKSEIICDICSKRFSTKTYLNIHRLHHGKPNFHCTVCGMAKFTSYELGLHMRKHDTNRKYFTCDICSKKFITKGSLNRHRQCHDTNRIYFTCDICPYKSSTKTNLKIHQECHDTNRIHLTCDICSKKCITKSSLKTHRKCHDTNRIYFTCDICPYKSSRNSNLTMHRKCHDTNRIYFTCDTCPEKYLTKKTLARHRLRHGKPNFHCTVCGKSQFTQIGLEQHMRVHNTKDETNSTFDICPNKLSSEAKPSIPTIDGEPHSNQTIKDEFTETEDEMEFCDEVEIDALNTSEATAAENHAEPEGNKNKSEFICDICSKKFITKASLNRHRKCHDTNRIYFTCDICSKKYSTKAHLTKHRLHHGQPNLHCTVCGVPQFTQIEMKRHMKVHNTEHNTNFTCDICAKKLASQYLLNQHRKRHAEPNFHCTVCNVPKFTKEEMVKHMRMHDANPKMFPCDICSKKFTRKSGLQNHGLRHGKPNLDCNVCGVAKLSEYAMNRHMRTHDTN